MAYTTNSRSTSSPFLKPANYTTSHHIIIIIVIHFACMKPIRANHMLSRIFKKELILTNLFGHHMILKVKVVHFIWHIYKFEKYVKGK